MKMKREPYLTACKILEITNDSIIARLVNDFLPLNIVAMFKHCSVTSVDFERSCYDNKLILIFGYKHRKLTSENRKNWCKDIAHTFPYTSGLDYDTLDTESIVW
jgi:hypothetical protein